VADVQAQTLVWTPGVRPGLPPKRGRRDAPNTISVKELALSLKALAPEHFINRRPRVIELGIHLVANTMYGRLLCD
jgi:hypothetical protein